MSLRVDSSSTLNPNLKCDLNTDIAGGDSAPPLSESGAPVCTANAPEAADPAARLNSAIGQVQLRTNTINNVKSQAKAAGLSQTEADALGDTLDNYQGRDFNREVDLVRTALGSDNPA